MARVLQNDDRLREFPLASSGQDAKYPHAARIRPGLEYASV